MDGETLCAALQATLNPDRVTRQGAEAALQQVRGVPGFLAELLKTAASEAVDPGVRLASAIYFKNLIRREWSSGGSASEQLFCEDEKAVVRDNLLEVLVLAPGSVRAQMALAMKSIAYSDFPDKWPGLFPAVMANMQSGDQTRVMGALIALRVLAKRFEFAKDLQPLDGLVSSSFPVLLGLFRHLQKTNDQSVESHTMQKLVCKVFWSSTHNDVPAHLRKPTEFRPWMELFMAVLKQPVEVSVEEAAAHPGWKARKWITEIFYRLYSRYGDPKLVTGSKQTVKFAERFMKEYAAKVLRLLFELLAAKGSGAAYLSDRVCNAALQYCTLGIRYPNTYKVMKSQLPAVISEIIFPFFCFTAADQELWDEDPAEFIRMEHDLMGEFYDPRVSAGHFLTSLIAKRQKDALDITVQFLVQLLTTYAMQFDPATRNYASKDGALLAIGLLGPVLKKKAQYRSSLEDLIHAHVMMEFQSPVGFLRARACWVYGQFSDIKFKFPANMLTSLERVVGCMADSELPVRVQAALALQKFLRAEQLTEEIRPVVPQLLQSIFSLMNDIENEDLVSTLETLVDTFPEQVAPLAVPCAQQLAASFVSYIEKEAADEDDETAAMAAANCLGTLSTLLMAVHDLPLFPELQGCLLPLLAQNLSEDRVEYLEETLEVIRVFTFYSKPITEELWQMFPMLVQAWNEFGYDYFQEFLPCIRNYITEGTERFCCSEGPKGLVFKMCEKVLKQPDSTQQHCGTVAQLMETVFIRCTGQADELVAPFVTLVCGKLFQGGQKIGSALRVLLASVIANAWSYNAPLAIEALVSLGEDVTAEVLQTMIVVVPDLERVHDKKVIILGLSSLIGVAHMQLPGVFNAGMQQLLSTTLRLMEACHTQKMEEKAAAEAEEDEEEEEESSDDEEEEDDEDDSDDAEDVDEDGEDAENEEDARYLAMLTKMAAQSENMVEWEEEEAQLDEDEDSLLENIDEKAFFLGKLAGLRQANAAVADGIVSTLDAESGALLSRVMAWVPNENPS